MSFKKKTIFFCIISLFFAVTCAANTPPLSVVVTLPPLHSLVSSVMKGQGTPHLLINGAISEHHYSLRPSDAKLLQKATIIFYASDYLEQFIPHMAKNLNKAVFLAPMSQAKNLTLYPNREALALSDHKTDHESHKPPPYDVHFWLDPINGIRLTSFIVETLSAKDPDNAALYEENGKKLITRLYALDAFLQTSFAPFHLAPYYVFHDAYQYLERRYHLSFKGTLSHAHHHHIMSLKSIDPLRQELKNYKGQKCCLFREPQFSSVGIDYLSNETHVKIGIWDPMGANIPEGPENYFTLLQNLAKNFMECFS